MSACHRLRYSSASATSGYSCGSSNVVTSVTSLTRNPGRPTGYRNSRTINCRSGNVAYWDGHPRRGVLGLDPRDHLIFRPPSGPATGGGPLRVAASARSEGSSSGKSTFLLMDAEDTVTP